MVTNQPQHTTATIPAEGSVILIDGNGDPATTVTVAGQGTYVLDPATGGITFTPLLGFTGTPDPVQYEITDAYGQLGASTFTPGRGHGSCRPGRRPRNARSPALARAASRSTSPSPSRPAGR